MRNFILGFVLAAIAFGGGYWLISKHGSHGKTPEVEKAIVKYHCPMHPTYISDKPGDCPICGMKLVPMQGADEHEKAANEELAGPQKDKAGEEKERKILYYVDAMNPKNRSDKPGKAPDGMDMVPVYDEETPATGDSSVPGYVPVKITSERQQMMGIITEEAKKMDLEQSIRTVGRVTADETRMHHIHTKFEGYIEQIYVNFVGQNVKSGDPLFSIYSPELLASQREYLLALKAREEMNDSEQGMRLPGVDLVESARERLSLWDITKEQIEQIEKTREPIRALLIRSPVSGLVSAKTALQGMKVMPSDTLYDITDLSSIWVQADVYEINLPFVKVGLPAVIQLPYQSGKTLRGRVTFINPTLDEKTRTVKARLEFPNPDQMLKPEMFVDVIFGGTMGKGIAVPESAVISTGERMIVFVAKGDGIFEPREVLAGLKVRGFYEIKKGIAAGEKVVTGANFLLDSESKLKASISSASGEHKHGQ
jgi:membrane fusion protein, copper/silver efflux system